MDARGFRRGCLCGALSVAAMALTARVTIAQGPSVDIKGQPGISTEPRRLNTSLGSAGLGAFDRSPGAADDLPLGGRPGASSSRAPIGGLNPPGNSRGEAIPSVRPLPPATEDLAAYGDLEIPAGDAFAGSQGGFTLDEAIDQLMTRSLGLLALRHEIPIARANVLTASLRANPVLYFDTQLVPYGRYSSSRPGGPPQYDVNVTIPLDVSCKRRARTIAAEKALRVTEAQFQDAVRQELDNLYTNFVDATAAEETLRYIRLYRDGIRRLLQLNIELLRNGQVNEAAVDAFRSQAEQVEFQIREAEESVGRSRRMLARMLSLPAADVEARGTRDLLRDVAELPLDEASLIQMALASRPDLAAQRLGVERANADVNLAHAERYSDVYLLAQPYTFQDNTMYGQKSVHSWALGMTVPLPVFNRNQGNIAPAKINVHQTRIELEQAERAVLGEVEEAIREYRLSRDGLIRLEQDILPPARRVRDANARRLQGGETNAIDYLEAQRTYNDVVRLYRDALVRHRRSMLRLNTAVGSRVTR